MVTANNRISCCTILLVLACTFAATSQSDTIRVFASGSSSFGEGILIGAKEIIEAEGQYVFEYETSGYTRLDEFVKYPYMYGEWCDQNIPRIESGDFDFVVFQTIGWYNLTPEQQDELQNVVLPDLAEQIRQAGSEMTFYDKYAALEHFEHDSLARTWAGCYPEGVRFNYLQHVRAARNGGVSRISFGGGAVHELWDIPEFAALDWLYNESGHPGPIANYITSCNFAWIFAGVNPVGSTVRRTTITGYRLDAFNNLQNSTNPSDIALYNDNVDRVIGEYLVLTPWEADTLQRTAMRWHQTWTSILEENASSDAAFAQTQADIDAIQAERGNFADYNLSDGKIEGLTLQCSVPDSGEVLSESDIEAARTATTKWTATLRNKLRDYIWEQEKEVHNEYVAFWAERNSKLRDDVFFTALVDLKAAQLSSVPDETLIHQLDDACGVFTTILSMAGIELMFQRITVEQQHDFIDNYWLDSWGGAVSRLVPALGAQLMAVMGDIDQVLAVVHTYFSVWDDPDLMDELKAEAFAPQVWHKADSLFLAAWVEQGGAVGSVPRPGSVSGCTPVVQVLPHGLAFVPVLPGQRFTVTVTDPGGRVIDRLSGSRAVSYAWPERSAPGVYVVRYTSVRERRTIACMRVR